jgi:leucyl/phenylalanyl-tRNA--protein transferase
MPKDAPGLTPELLLHGYSMGVFPMAEHKDDPDVFWVDPKRRGIIPLDGFHMSKSLARAMRKTEWQFGINRHFRGVVMGCADRSDTWISEEIANAYQDLHRRGHAHSYEVWSDHRLVGGVYGVTLGAAFFGESMFSKETNASKMALAGCVDHLRSRGFRLFDTQFLTDHLAQLGAIEVTRARYQSLLRTAIAQPSRPFHATSSELATPCEVSQRMRALQ